LLFVAIDYSSSVANSSTIARYWTPTMSTTLPFFPEVSVIVPIYNGEQDVSALIDCLARQTYPRQLVEYILVDNNSSDRTSELLATAVQEQAELNLIIISENQIQSAYAARNQGIRIARHSFLAFTDADCRPTPQWLTELIQPLQYPNIGLVAGEITALNGSNWLEKYAERRQFMSPKFLLEHSFCPYGQTANLAIRREAFQKVGLFRPYLTTGGDADICWRIQQQTDWQLTYAEKAVIYHRHRSNLKDLKSQLQRYGRSNRYLHELHGVELMRPFTNQQLFMSLSRWLLKDIPKNSLKLLFGKADLVDLLGTPVDLICFQARSQGQATAKLPEKAQEIDWF
jgi:cellulose synthase/poly-beta-1,6-N-acetylglucosamine synthase-like glycosyltransferase